VVRLIDIDKCIAIKADAEEISQLKMLVAETVKTFGKIDILVLNASIMPLKNLESSTKADFDRTMRLNVKGLYFLAQVS
jgi:3-oxoacyl-[acyl-carrier protein] reductase